MQLERLASLTHYELVGLEQRFGFGDGHAYQDLNDHEQAIIAVLPEIYERARATRQRAAERAFARSFFRLAGQLSATERDLFKVCPSASQSIDLVASFLSKRKMRVALMEPTFDNLYLVLKRWNIDVVPLAEHLIDDDLATHREIEGINALFLVMPNNPTGKIISRGTFERIVEHCARRRIALILDTTFRFFVREKRSVYDAYAVMEEHKCSFFVIEDTGKTWSTLDLKASILAYSADVQEEIEELFHAIFLGISPFALLFLEQMVGSSLSVGLRTYLWDIVDRNRAILREAIAGSCLEPVRREGACMPVEWTRIAHESHIDTDIVSHLDGYGLTCLPGSHFYWCSPALGRKYVRFSLLKPFSVVRTGCAALREALNLPICTTEHGGLHVR